MLLTKIIYGTVLAKIKTGFNLAYSIYSTMLLPYGIFKCNSIPYQ